MLSSVTDDDGKPKGQKISGKLFRSYIFCLKDSYLVHREARQIFVINDTLYLFYIWGHTDGHIHVLPEALNA